MLQTASNTASEQVTRNSEELMAAGGFGVPTFRIGDEIVFGQDRIDLVSDVLRGWTPDLEGGAEVLLSGERGKL